VPTGYRVVLIEKNSHFNYWFAFPRYSVIKGYEEGAFIPYEDILAGPIKKGSLLRVQAEAADVTDKQVVLANGEAMEYEYLVIATGSSQPPPAKMKSLDREGAAGELRANQGRIAAAKRIAVIGSGAVGVEVASDIKGYFPDKAVTLFSSRDVVMPSFAPKLRTHVASRLEHLGVDLRYHARPRALEGGKAVQFPDGTTEEFDLVVSYRLSQWAHLIFAQLPCTGQSPNSGLIGSFLPEAISKQTGRILVKPNFQLKLADHAYQNIFALGDVAEHGGPRMARAVYVQAGIVRDNLLQMIKGGSPSKEYKPEIWMEGAIQLTVGKVCSAPRRGEVRELADSDRMNRSHTCLVRMARICCFLVLGGQMTLRLSMGGGW